MTIDLESIPQSPTLRDIYKLIAITSQQLANYAEELIKLRADLTRLISHQEENVQANARSVIRLEQDVGELRVQVKALEAWQLAHQFSCPFVGNGRAVLRSQIGMLLHNYFNPEEMNDLVFKLGLSADDIPGDSHSERATQLLLMAERRGLVKQLLILCQKERPNISWPIYE